MPAVFLNTLWVYTLLALGIWIHRVRRALQTLKKIPVLSPAIRTQPQTNEALDFISVLIPVRNEARNIRDLLDSLLSQDYASFEIIVADNDSTDQTPALLEAYGDRIQRVRTPQTPEGWTGKNFALSEGIKIARGNWFLFTDADTRHQPASLRTVLDFARENQAAFITALPECLAQGFWENLIQPTAMSFLGLWFPIEKNNDPRSPLAFANGQYLFIRRDLYEKIGGHAAVKAEFLEDFGSMKKTKECGERAICALGVEVYGTRMYETNLAIWRGWRRIYLHAFDSNPWALLLKSADLFVFSALPYLCVLLVPWLCLVSGEGRGGLWLAALLIALALILCVTSWKAFRIVRAKGVYSLLEPLGAFVLSLILIDAASKALQKKPTPWR